MGIWHLRRSTLLGEAEQGDTVAESSVEELQEPMLCVVDRVAEPGLVEAPGWLPHSEVLEPADRRPEQTESCTEALRVAALAGNGGRRDNETLQFEASSAIQMKVVADQLSSAG